MLTLDFEKLEKNAKQKQLFCSDPIEYGTVTACNSSTIKVSGLKCSLGALVKIQSSEGVSLLAEVTAINGGETIVTPYNDIQLLSVGASVSIVSNSAELAVGESVIGRTIDSLGNPIDGKGPVFYEANWPCKGKLENSLNRGTVTNILDVGVRSINALLTIGCGQRMALIAGSGVGKSVLLQQIATSTKADVIVLGLIGERAREINGFLEAIARAGSKSKTVAVAAPAIDSPLLRIKAAQRATSIAEYFRHIGKNVLLVMDSLTRVAHAQREIGLSLGEPATMKGYPPSALGIIPQLIERSGLDIKSGGSITAFYTVLADGDDLADPIVDSAKAITDGHIVLDRKLAEQGTYPAISVSASTSRVMHDIVDPEQLRAAGNFRRLLSSYNENMDLIKMGAYQEGGDALLDMAITRHPEQLLFLGQGMEEQVNYSQSSTELIQGFGQ